MSATGAGDQELSQEEKNQIWLGRARNLLTGIEATSKYVEIYGLRIRYVSQERDFVDIFTIDQSDSDNDLTYIDTIQIAQFTTTRGFLAQLRSYFADEQEIPEEPEDGEADGNHSIH